MNRRIHILPTSGAVAVAAADILLEAVAEGTVSVALSGGSTPRAMYRELASRPATILDPLRRSRYFFGDERAVGNYHPESNVALAVEEFILPCRIPWSRVYTVDGGTPNLEAEAARYDAVLRTVMKPNADGQPVLDLVFLGLGDDGHTASLFPGTKALGETRRCYVANEVPQKKTRRLTLTLPAINAARRVVFVVTGEGKAAVVAEILGRGDADPVYPSEQVEPARSLWLLDEAAASALDPATRAAIRP